MGTVALAWKYQWFQRAADRALSQLSSPQQTWVVHLHGCHSPSFSWALFREKDLRDSCNRPIFLSMNLAEGGSLVGWTTSIVTDLRAASGSHPLFPPLSHLGTSSHLSITSGVLGGLPGHVMQTFISQGSETLVTTPFLDWVCQVHLISYSGIKEQQEEPSGSPGTHTYPSLSHCGGAQPPAHGGQLLLWIWWLLTCTSLGTRSTKCSSGNHFLWFSETHCSPWEEYAPCGNQDPQVYRGQSCKKAQMLPTKSHSECCNWSHSFCHCIWLL